MAFEDYVKRSSALEWQPLIENEVHYHGVFVKSLRFDQPTNRSKTILLKFEPGSSYPYHNHPAGEEIFCLEGSCEVFEGTLNAGDYLYTPPNGKHSVKTDVGCVLLLSIPEEVELL